MDLSGLTSVNTAPEMLTWLAENCLTPIEPVMTGTDFGIIMAKIIGVSGAGGILNQNDAAQPDANFWISGAGRFNDSVVVGNPEGVSSQINIADIFLRDTNGSVGFNPRALAFLNTAFEVLWGLTPANDLGTKWKVAGDTVFNNILQAAQVPVSDNDVVRLVDMATLAAYTSNNGITESGGNFQLGGSIFVNTYLDTGSHKSLNLGDIGNGRALIRIDPDNGDVRLLSIAADQFSNSFVIANDALAEIGFRNTAPTKSSLLVTASAITLQDQFNSQGIINGGDYEANFVARSLATVQFVTNLLADYEGALGYTAENAANKNISGGYAGLDGSGKVAAAQLPSYVDDVLEVANFAALPGTGETGKIYVTLDSNLEYRWSGSTYIQIVASPGTTDAVAEGTTNLYFTAARVRAAVLTGISFVSAAAVLATDSLLIGIGKLQAQITALLANTVDLSTNQTVAGVKTFEDDVIFNGNMSAAGIASGAIFQNTIPGDLLLQGGNIVASQPYRWSNHIALGQNTGDYVIFALIAGFDGFTDCVVDLFIHDVTLTGPTDKQFRFQTNGSAMSGSWRQISAFYDDNDQATIGLDIKEVDDSHIGLRFRRLADFSSLGAPTDVGFWMQITPTFNITAQNTDGNDVTEIERYTENQLTFYKDQIKKPNGSRALFEDDVLVIFNDQAGDYTLAIDDVSVDIDDASPNSLTIPPDSSALFPVGFSIIIWQKGIGQTTVTPGAGVTINSAAGLTKLRVQHSVATLVKTATNTWLLSGDLA
jgi:hypothetical protein